eukprot:CAMPEP_0119388058 /NCGR_PEP_ID=MMETSP1334-20130426/103411_1 /TAXON_ID=127549 /ORGANISM="Calcidiscus leptoporus, Strain RCC1130" /LENGTH=76 /DNA_ID=CAMNT_0007409939 /DNA_START=30 /DNA_END=260 /DNA_ORIENTATION=+
MTQSSRRGSWRSARACYFFKGQGGTAQRCCTLNPAKSSRCSDFLPVSLRLASLAEWLAWNWCRGLARIERTQHGAD